MPVLKKVEIVLNAKETDELKFTYQISVTKDGKFTTTLPKDIAQKFKDVGISILTNRLGNIGYYEEDTLDELQKKIKDICSEYTSEEIIEEKLVIRFAIRTTAAYCLDNEKNIIPNGGWAKGGEYLWREGTIMQNANYPHSFGFEVYAQIFLKQVKGFKSGREKTEYKKYRADSKGDYFIYYLNEFCAIKPPDNTQIQEVDCTPDTAKFFVDLLLSICRVNEKIKDFLNPEAITELASLKIGLLQGGSLDNSDN